MYRLVGSRDYQHFPFFPHTLWTANPVAIGAEPWKGWGRQLAVAMRFTVNSCLGPPSSEIYVSYLEGVLGFNITN